MNLLILLFFGILSTSHGDYEIPEHDPCVLRVIICDDFIKPLTPADNSTLEMFETIGELNAVCEGLSKFRVCLKNAEIFCKEYATLNVGFQLLNNRRLAFDLCARGSNHQHVYMMVEGCVNKYSRSAIEFCTNKAVETVGMDFVLGDIDNECRFLGEMQYCHIAIVTDRCGGIAGNLLEKLAVFRGERDFMCIGYEKERLSNIKAFYATMDSYVEQYKNIVNQLEMEDESQRTDPSKRDFKTRKEFMPGQASSKFQPRISPLINDGAFGNIYRSDNERYFNSKAFHHTEQPLYSLSDRKIDSKTVPPKTGHCSRLIKEKADKALSYENSACKTKASFLLTGIRRNGKPYYLGGGEAIVLWAASSPLQNIHCAWMVNPAAPLTLARCSILIYHTMVVEEDPQIKGGKDLRPNATLGVYETINDREAKRVAELRVLSFVKNSSSIERSLKFFRKHARDIRYWCSKQHEIDKYTESNRVHSASRIGLMPSDGYKNGMVDRENGVSDQKYNFYVSENAKYPIDTEVHSLSSTDRNIENEFKVEDAYIYPNSDENLNPSLFDEIVNGKKLEESFTLHPPKPSKSLHHSYRPYELFRPRVGEDLEVDQDVSSENLRIEHAETGSPEPKILSIEDAIEDKYTTRLNTAEMCPLLQENISELVNKFAGYSIENPMNMADPLDMVELENFIKFPVYKREKGVPFSNKMWKVEELENVNSGNQHDEIYIVTPSTEIEMHGGPYNMIYEDSEARDLGEDSQILNSEDDSEDLVKVAQENDAGVLELEKAFITKSTNPRRSEVDFLKFMSNSLNNRHPFSYNIFDASTNQEIASEEEFSAKSDKMFNRRSEQKYPSDREETLLDAFVALAEIKINARRMRKILKETQMEKISKFLIKNEL